ncbi:MAG: hypothetical protein ACNA71_04600 [Kiritimatiellia bacterium]
MIRITIILAVWLMTVLAGVARADEDLTRAALRARLALLRLRTAVSYDRVFSVSGPRADSNAIVLDLLQQTRAATEQLLGVSMPVRDQSIRVLVRSPGADSGQDAGSDLHLERQAGQLIYRVRFADYSHADLPAAQALVLQAILAAYVVPLRETRDMVRIPGWFLQGILEVLYPDDRKLALATLDRLWRSGAIPSLATFFQEAQAWDTLAEEQATVAGGVVYWLATLVADESIMPAVLRRIAANEPIDVDWLLERLGSDPDAMFDRWMLSQRRTVRGVGTVMRAHIDHLRSVLLLYPGQHGIPRGAPVVWGAPLHMLVRYRDHVWFEEAVRQRRQLLQLAVQGRPDRYKTIVAAFLVVLDGVRAGGDIEDLEDREQLAYIALELLARDVDASGGIWRE